MPSSRFKCGKKLRNMSPRRFVSTPLDKSFVTGKIRRVLYVNFECLFWPIKCMHSKPRFWVRNKDGEKSVSHIFGILHKTKKFEEILCKIPTGTLGRSVRDSRIRRNFHRKAPSKSTLCSYFMLTVLLQNHTKLNSEKSIDLCCK